MYALQSSNFIDAGNGNVTVKADNNTLSFFNDKSGVFTFQPRLAGRRKVSLGDGGNER